MAEQQVARADKQAGDKSGSAVATMATPIFDELLREMAADNSARKQSGEPGRQAAQGESRHRVP